MKTKFSIVSLFSILVLLPLFFNYDILYTRQISIPINMLDFFKAPSSINHDFLILLHQNDTFSLSVTLEGCKVKALEFNYSIIHVSTGKNWNIYSEAYSDRLILPVFKSPREGVYRFIIHISIDGNGRCTAKFNGIATKGNKKEFINFYYLMSTLGFMFLVIIVIIHAKYNKNI